MTQEFALTPVLDNDTGKYVIDHFDAVLQTVKEYIDAAANAIAQIADPETLRLAKDSRTEIRKKKEAIKDARIQINALLLGQFNEQLKTIEGMLDEADKSLKAKIDAYNEETKGPQATKPKVMTLTVKGYDAKAIEKVKKLALSLGLQAEVK